MKSIRNIAVVTIALPLAMIIGHAVLKREFQPRIAATAVATTIDSASRAADVTADPPTASARDRAATASRSGRDSVRAVARRPVPSVGRLTPLAQSDDARWR
jgi:hypothetical protein